MEILNGCNLQTMWSKLILSEELLCSSCGTDDIDFSVLFVTLYSLMIEDGVDVDNVTMDEFEKYLERVRGD